MFICTPFYCTCGLLLAPGPGYIETAVVTCRGCMNPTQLELVKRGVMDCTLLPLHRKEKETEKNT